MKQYHDLMWHILANGTRKNDRTGTGTLSVFGHQMRFDLMEGFPLVTTKKIHLKSVIEELLWFLEGYTNVKSLGQSTQHWWTPWQEADGSLGPIYGEQYRRARWWFEVEPLIFPPPDEPPRVEGLFAGVGDLGERRNEGGRGEEIAILKNTWRDIIKRCYDANSTAYPAYGGNGVHMCDAWLDFEQFAKDAVTLPGWLMKLEWPDDFSIDKDIRRASNRYSKDTCMWASKAEQGWNTSTNRPFTARTPGGEELLFPSLGEANRQFGLNISAAHRCLNGLLHTHHGWSDFKYVEPLGRVRRFRELDQLKRLIASLRREPDSRRHMINLWNTPAMEHAALPCCHGSIIQFYVANGKLSCQMYQRSADVFIGLPVNIASYSLLTMMIAHVVGLQPGEFIWTGGDCHLYSNHFDQAQEQLVRECKRLPDMLLNCEHDSIDDFVYDDFELINYDPWPAIKAPVAV